jgi:hypothetical protein
VCWSLPLPGRTMATKGFYETIVMTGHALAFGVLRSRVEPATVNAWLASDHPSARKAGVAGWSKVAEEDSDQVDVDALVTERSAAWTA